MKHWGHGIDMGTRSSPRKTYP